MEIFYLICQALTIFSYHTSKVKYNLLLPSKNDLAALTLSNDLTWLCLVSSGAPDGLSLPVGVPCPVGHVIRINVKVKGMTNNFLAKNSGSN